jgi:hypothetical protein
MRRSQCKFAVRAARAVAGQPVRPCNGAGLFHRNACFVVAPARDGVRTERLHALPFLFGNCQGALRFGHVDRRQRHQRRARAHFLAHARMAAHHERFDTRSDQRGAVGVVEHLARCPELFVERGLVELGEDDARGLQGGRIELDRLRCAFLVLFAFLAFLVCFAFLVLLAFLVRGAFIGVLFAFRRSRRTRLLVTASEGQREQDRQCRNGKSHRVHRIVSPFAPSQPSQRSSWPVAARYSRARRHRRPSSSAPASAVSRVWLSCSR